MRPKSIEEFTDLLQRSRLLTEEELGTLAKQGANSCEQLARRLVRMGWLTKWQALTLLEGRCQFFIGRYKLLELIGSGGMGAVFKAIRPDIGRVVAVKVLKPKSLKKSTGLPRFLREIESAASLDHPNIVRAYDADEVNGTYLLVMEYIEGRDLKNYITSDQPMTLPWICECIRQAALGLQHAADQGMVHRDIKPANLMVCQTDSQIHPIVKILDFGLARFVSETEEDGGLTRVGQAVGTPDYIAPEQAQNSKSADIRADIYSLGCTFFEMLTGQIPFPVDNLTEKLLQRVYHEAPRVRSLRPEISQEIDEIVAQMLRRNPAERYQTPAELAAALLPHSLMGQARPRGTSATNPSVDQNSEWNLAAEDYQKFLVNLEDDAGASDSSRTVTVPGRQSSANISGSRKSFLRRRGLAVAGFTTGLLLLLGWYLLSTPRGSPRPGGAGSSSRPPSARDSQRKTTTSSKQTAPSFLADLLEAGVILLTETTRQTPGATSWPLAGPDNTPRFVLEVEFPWDLPSDPARVLGVRAQLSPLVTNETLQTLTRLPNLESASFHGCSKLNDSSLVELGKLHSLQELSLVDLPISDRGLADLKALKQLRSLTLTRNRLNGSGLSSLAGLHKLTFLALDFNRLNSSAFQQLAQLKSLQNLSLNGVSVGLADLRRLAQLPSLKVLSLGSTGLSSQSLSELRSILPQVSLNP
jgi:serine/threonine protein kinase